MAFLLQSSINKECADKKIDFLDISGLYNNITNPTGYGLPNITFSQLLTATLSVLYPNGAQAEDIELTVQQVEDMVNTGVPIPITPSMFGLSDFEDGYGSVNYIITGEIGSGPEILATAEIGIETEIDNTFFVNGTQITDAVTFPGGATRQEQYDALEQALADYGSGYTLAPYPGEGIPFTLIAPTGSGSTVNGYNVTVTNGDTVGTFSGGSAYTTYTPFTYSVLKEFFWDCGVVCCVAKMGADASEQGDPCCDDCDRSKKYKKALLALDLMHAAICCGNKNAANKQLAKLKLLCSGSDCGCH